MLPSNSPLAVIHALLRPLQVVSENGPQRTAPGHVCVGQEGDGAQLARRLARQKVVSGSGQDDRPRGHSGGAGRRLAALRGLAGLLARGRGRGGGGRGGAGVKRREGVGGFAGVGGKLASQRVALLLEYLC